MPATASASLVRMGRVTCIAHAGQLAYPMWRKVKDQIKAVRAQLEDGAQVQPGRAALVCARKGAQRISPQRASQAKPDCGRTPSNCRRRAFPFTRAARRAFPSGDAAAGAG